MFDVFQVPNVRRYIFGSDFQPALLGDDTLNSHRTW